MEDLRSILAKHGFSFKKQFGQNFISDTNLLKRIVALAEVTKEDTVIEIGCGAGTLTREISAAAGKVYAFEIDKNLQPVLAETLSGCDNTEVIFRDFLKCNLAEFEDGLKDYVVIANLPYYITTPLIMRFVEESQKVKRLVVMVQEEVAERFCAAENTPEYGAVTAAIARRADTKIVAKVDKSMFMPRPQVDSAVVRMDFVPDKIPVRSARAYRETVRCAFLSRRKTLENNLVNAFGWSREQAKEVMQRAGLPEKVRGETLSPQTLAALSDIICEYID